MQEITNWIPFNIKTNSSNIIEQVIDKVCMLEESTSTNLWVKWKDISNQVVIGTPKHYYKIYQNDVKSGLFLLEIREALAEIYRNLYDIDWNILHYIDDNYIYTIEQRQILTVCNENIISQENLLLNWSKTLKILEEKLQFKKICFQLTDKIQNLRHLKLIRDCLNKYNDYAITKNGEIILLDDADWFIALVDECGNWLYPKFDVYEISIGNEERLFAPQFLYERDVLEAVGNELVDKWHLFPANKNKEKEILQFCSNREKTLKDNIKILTLDKIERNETKQLFYD